MHCITEMAVWSYHEQKLTPSEIAWNLSVNKSTVIRYITNGKPQLQAPQTHTHLSPRICLTVQQQCSIIAFFCQSRPFPGMQRWTFRTAASAINANTHLLGRTVHYSTVFRVLSSHQLRPYKNKYFLHIRDQFFIEKMYHILAVYEKKSQYLFCFDECPNIQAISRLGPDIPRSDAGITRESAYSRNGTTDLFGFLQVSTGKIATYCRPSHETEILIEVFTKHVLSQPENEQLHYICDNLSPHFNYEFCKVVAQLSEVNCPAQKYMKAGEKRREWLQKEDKRIVIHFIPFHGSWLNQVEIWFGILRKNTLKTSWFESVEELINDIMAFANTWNDLFAHPFNFKFNGKGIEGVILRRFKRILSQDHEKIMTIDSKFLSDISLLSVRLFTRHYKKINNQDKQEFISIVKNRKDELQAIIDAETGPKRKKKAQDAFDKLLKQVI